MLYVFPLFCLMVLLIPILLPSSINLSFSAALLWLLIILISFFCFQYFSYSKLNVVYSSLLISESINDLDIIVSILFHLLLDSITILFCFPFLFGVVSNSFFIIPVVMEKAKLKLKLAIPISATITVEKKQQILHHLLQIKKIKALSKQSKAANTFTKSFTQCFSSTNFADKIVFKKFIISCKTHQTLACQYKHMSIRVFRHIAKSLSAAGLFRLWLGNTSTCPYVRLLLRRHTLQDALDDAKPTSSASCS